MRQYLHNIAIAFDQLANTILRGEPDETLSSRAHRMRVKSHRWWGWTANAIDALFWWQRDHCAASYEQELRSRQLPREFWRD